MTADRFQRVEDLVFAVLDLSPNQRGQLLRRECAGDDALQKEVESLLAFQQQAIDFISSPALVSAASLLADVDDEFDSVAGQHLGPYKLIRELGHGGMGAVYLAERTDEYRKQVAIKVVKHGLATHGLLTRFLHERQILAGLDHGNIAKLLDGGTTEDGSPYIVMDYVAGLPIDEYCDQQNLSIEARLRLFQQICSAVAYAHRNLVIHRDLKPSNILVTADGEPKLLDFGIAKVLDPSELPAHDPTATMARIMTPQYASPEQVRGLSVTTASDVYSLGVLLYKLLSGQLPYQLKNLRSGEIERIVCEKDPERPSLRISDFELRNAEFKTTSTSEATKPAKNNSQTAIRNSKFLKGDLDNIVLMAMRKEPERRYLSVDQFSEDIRRHLEGLPVIATKDTITYRASRFVHRHRLGVAAAVLIFLSLLGGLGTTAWQARVARQEKAKAESINAFLEQMLRYSNPITSTTRTNGHGTTVDEILDEAARRLDSGEFDASPELKAELERTVAQTYFGQGAYPQARKYMEQYVLLLRGLYDERHPKRIVGEILWAGVLFDKGEFGEAEKAYRRNLPLLKVEYKKGNIKTESVAEALNSFAYLRRTQGDSKEAELLFRESLEVIPLLSGEALNAVATTRSTLASTIADQGRFSEALQTAREAVDEYRRRGDTGSPSYAFSLNVLGGFLTDSGNFAEADTCLSDAESIFRRLLSTRNLWLGDNLRNQSISLYQQGKYQAANDKATEAAKLYVDSFGPHYDHYPTTLIISGLALARMGQSQEGERLLREALKIRTESLPPEHFWVAQAKGALGECLTIENRYEEAEALLLESYNSLNQSQGAQNPRTLLAKNRLVDLYLQWNKPDLADPYRAAKN